MVEVSAASDAILVARAQAGDEQAFIAIVVRYQQPVGSYIFRLLGDQELSSDLLQETFLDAFRTLSSLRDPALFRHWLYRIATNKVRGWQRRERLIRWLPLVSSVNSHRSPDLERAESRELIRCTLAKLGSKQVVSLLLHDFAGFSSKEVAKILGISTAAARKRITRGKEAFRVHYNNLLQDDVKTGGK